MESTTPSSFSYLLQTKSFGSNSTSLEFLTHLKHVFNLLRPLGQIGRISPDVLNSPRIHEEEKIIYEWLENLKQSFAESPACQLVRDIAALKIASEMDLDPHRSIAEAEDCFRNICDFSERITNEPNLESGLRTFLLSMHNEIVLIHGLKVQESAECRGDLPWLRKHMLSVMEQLDSHASVSYDLLAWYFKRASAFVPSPISSNLTASQKEFTKVLNKWVKARQEKLVIASRAIYKGDEYINSNFGNWTSHPTLKDSWGDLCKILYRERMNFKKANVGVAQEKYKEIIITFKGSTLYEFGNNFRTGTGEIPWFRRKLRGHRGYLNRWVMFQDSFVATMKRLKVSKNDDIFLTGHSQGGSMAILAALYLDEWLHPFRAIKLTTFSAISPLGKSGNEEHGPFERMRTLNVFPNRDPTRVFTKSYLPFGHRLLMMPELRIKKLSSHGYDPMATHSIENIALQLFFLDDANVQ